ncbi:MAG: hypothetical protein JW910_02350 [Anaerolineae bacterium]|nr:hypothetical protein [Anaerolineae bacterium]
MSLNTRPDHPDPEDKRDTLERESGGDEVPLPETFPRFSSSYDGDADKSARRPPRRPAPKRKGGCLLPALGVGVIVLSLVALALFLPPISLWEVIDEAINGTPEPAPSDPLAAAWLDFTPLSAGSPRVEADGLVIEAAPDTLAEAFGVYVAALSPAEYLAEQTPATGWNCDTDLPPRHALASPVYSLMQTGTPPDRLTLTITALEDAGAGVLALYTWNATTSAWEFLPAVPGATPGMLSADVAYLPRCVAMFRGSESARLAGVTLALNDTFAPGVLAANARVYPAGLRPTAAGTLQGVLAPGFQTGQGYAVMPLIQNFDDLAVIETATVQRILENPALRTEHARQVAAFVLRQDAGYAGVVIDYRDVPPALRDSYAAFLGELAMLLHSQDRTLAVVLPAPATSDADRAWDTGGYDWRAIGRAADEVVIAMPRDPLAYAPGGQAEQVIAWAAMQVSRDKLQIGLDALSVEDQGGGVFAPVTLDEALAYAGQVQLDPPDQVEPGQTVSASLVEPSGIRAQFGRDEAIQTPYVIYADASGATLATMWITDAAALRARLDLAAAANLGGVVVWNAMSPGALPGLDGALVAYRLDQPGEIAPFEWALAWTASAGDTVLEQASGQPDQPFSVQAQDGQGTITVEAVLNGIALGSQTVAVAAPAPTPTPEPTLEPASEATPSPESAPANIPAAGSPPVVPAGAIGTDFEPGAQIFQFNANSVLATGRTHLKWMRTAVVFLPGEEPDTRRQTINNAQANGFKILLSVTGNPADASADPAGYMAQYAAYVGGLAALGADGIEIWPGANRSDLWLAEQGGAAQYVQLLSLAYNAIKTANPDTIVITGALVPPESEPADSSVSIAPEDEFYTALAGAGAADYADCLGVAYTLGALPPDSTTGDPRGDAAVYYLPLTLDRAWNAFGGARQLCVTSLGYLTPQGYPPLPAAYAWAQNTTTAQQAEWLVGAVTQSQQDARIRLLILSNMDATSYNDESVTAGYALIRLDGTCPACEALAPVLEE